MASLKNFAPQPSFDAGRDPVIDIARGSAMLLVIFGHTLLIFFLARPDGGFDPHAFSAAQAIQSFHMPAFYFISGMAALRLHERNFYQTASQALTLIFFAYITHLMAVPFVGAAHGDLLHPLNLIKLAVRPLVLGKDFALMVPWFLISLAIVQCLAWIYLRGSAIVKISMIIGLAAIFIADANGLKVIFMDNTWGIGLFFFLVGRAFSGVKKPAITPRLAAVAASVTIGLVTILHPLNKGCPLDPISNCNQSTYPSFGVNIVAGQVGFLPLFLVTAFLGIASLILLAQAVKPFRASVLLVWIGQNTLSLLILNGAFLVLATPVLAAHISLRPWAWLVWSMLITAGHVAVLPFIKPGMDRLQNLCRLAGDGVIHIAQKHFPERI
ncbi:acyltransferase family protein [Asticcacaulis endophyticus]|uniref:Acyltransferase n=1 Tax=Asticcacaulis endophyticus TaxID=1395890 RepID=A0A918QAS2_9CAUL|nr:acyltransferase family protein [Asticcacaulis endophyticus]GGZ37390.1 acyltransferase [Asticcacaulis endophyticus]